MDLRRLQKQAAKALLVAGLVSVSFGAAAQAGLEVSGAIKEGRKGLEGTKVTLYKNGSVDKTFTTTSNGKFEFFFESNATYVLDVAKPGYVAKKIEFNTSVPAEVTNVFDFEFIVELFQDQSGLNKAIFANPVAKVHYNERYREFDYDLDYTMEFQKQEEEVFQELERIKEEEYKEEEKQRKEAEQLAKQQAKEAEAAKKAAEQAEKERLAAEEKKRQEAEAEAKRVAAEAAAKAEAEKKAREDEYANLVKEADKMMKDGSFELAKAKYEEAQRIIPDKQLTSEIAEAEKSIAKAKAEAEERVKKEKQFNDLVKQAEDLAKTEKYEAAINLYETAADINPDSDVPNNRIKELNEKVAAIAKAEEEKRKLDNDFAKLMKEGEEAEGIADYGKAKDKYNAAAGLKPEVAEPKNRIKAIDDLLAQLDKERREAEEKQKQFDQLMAKGDKAVTSEAFAEAKSSFEQALAIFPEEQSPKDKIAEVTQLIADKQKQEAELKAKQEEFAQLMSQGGSLQSERKLQDAKARFEEALALKIDDNAAQARISEVNELIKQEQKAEAEKAAQIKSYQDAISRADQLFGNEKFDDAIAEYKKASGILPEEQYPQQKIKESEQRLAEIAKAQKLEQEKQLAYEDAMNKGNQLLENQDYEAAMASFAQAQELRPEKEDAGKKLDEVKTAMAKAKAEEEKRLAKQAEEERKAEVARLVAEKQKTFDDLIQKGDQALSTDNYQLAIENYQEAKELMPENNLATKKLDEVNGIVEAKKQAEAEAAAKKARFDELISAGIELKNADQLEDARSKFSEAKKLDVDNATTQGHLTEIEGLISERQQMIKEQADLQKQYDAALGRADRSFEKENYAEAAELYTVASGLLSNEEYPKNRKQEAEAKLAEQKAQQEQNEAFDAAFANANQLFESGDLENAKSAFESALEIKPADGKAQEKLKAVESAIQDKLDAEQAMLAKEEADRKAAEEQARLEEEQRLAEEAEAKAKAEAERKAAEDKARLEEEQRLAAEAAAKREEENAKEAAEKQREFDTFISKGDQALTNQEYQFAKESYEGALAIFSDSESTKKKIAQVDALIADKQRAEAEMVKTQQDFEDLMAEGSSLQNSMKYTEALEKYRSALKLEIDNPKAESKISELQQLISQEEEFAKEQKENQKKYEAAIKRADAQLKNSKLDEAMALYKEAAELVPDKEYPKGQILEIEKLQAQRSAEEELEAEYAAFMAKGDELIQLEELEQARFQFEKALELKPGDKQAQKRLEDLFAAITKKAEEEKARLAKEEAEKLAESEKARLEEEKRLAAEAEANRKAEEARLAEERQKEAAAAREAEELAKAKANEEAERRAAEEKARREEEQRLAAEAEAKRKEEEARIAEEKRKSEEAAKEEQRLAEAQAKAEEEQRAEEERAAYEAELKRQEELKLQAEERARQEAELAKAKAEEEKRLSAEQKRKADEERMRLEEESKRLAKEEEERRLAEVRQAEEERRAKLAEEQRLEQEAKRKEAEEARAKAEADRRLEQQRLAAEEDRKRYEREQEEARRQAEEERLKAQNEAELKALAEAAEKEKSRMQLYQDSIAQADADRMEQEAQAILEKEIAERDARMKAEVEAKVRKELQKEFEETLKEQRSQEEQDAAVAAAIKRETELRERRKEQERQQKVAMMETRKRQELEAWEKKEEEAARKKAEREAAEAASKRKMEQEQAEIEAELARKEEQAKAAAEHQAERAAELEARRLKQEEENQRKQQLAEEWKVLREKAEIERLEEQRRLDAEKIERGQAELARIEQEKIENLQQRKDEITEAGVAAAKKKEVEEQMRLEREQKRKEEIALKEENFRNKQEFEKKAKEIAESTVESDRELYEKEVRLKLQQEYAQKMKALQDEKEKQTEAAKPKPTPYEIDLAKNYPMGVTEESEIKDNREIKHIIIKREENRANKYTRVKWNWGGIYYFKNDESTSKHIYDQETKW